MFMQFFFSYFLYKSTSCGYSFEFHQQDAIKMGTHMCVYKEYTKSTLAVCNLKTTKSLDCAYRGMCGNKVEYGMFLISPRIYVVDTH